LEALVVEQRPQMMDKVWQWTDPADGKTYTILAFNDWTVDQPDGLIATMRIDNQKKQTEPDYKHNLVLMDEQGNITERKLSEFFLNIQFYQKGNAYCLSDQTNLRLVSVTSEKHQQIIDALHKFENK
ncbi:MAG: hypothetical protein J6X46_05515, partial [Prevotella sp.]|nr:hypothetical protein [Prevotella sp.]